VEWLSSLPPDLNLSNGKGKALLKKALEPYLPREILYRPKMGFAVPLAQWFRGPLREPVRRAVLGPVLAETGWFDAGLSTPAGRGPPIGIVGPQYAAVDTVDVRIVPAQRDGYDRQSTYARSVG
jgi:hypothetical protein